MSRNNSSLIDDIIDLSASLPCWLSSFLAVLSYFLLHQFASITPEQVWDFAEFGDLIVKQMFKTLAFFFQFILPVAFLIGTLVTTIKTLIHNGFTSATKSLAIAFGVSLITITLFVFWRPSLAPEIANSNIFQKIFKSFLSPEKDVTTTREKTEPTQKSTDLVFSQEELAAVQAKLLQEGQDNTFFFIQLNSGNSILAKKIKTEGDLISFENEKGLIVTINKQEVSKVRKLVRKVN